MRRNAMISGASLFVFAVILLSPALGQFPGGGKKGGGGGFGGGGFGGGGPGGGGPGGGMGGMMGDPGRMFDFLAKGRPYFLVTETKSLREPLTQFLQQRGVTNGQITRELFTQFSEQSKMKGPGGGGSGQSMAGGFPKQPFGQGGATMMIPGGAPGVMTFSPGGFSGGLDGGFRINRGSPFDAMNQFADAEFNRRDINGDGVLNLDEMPDSIKNDLARVDLNHDNLIDINEYRSYFMARMQGGGGEGGRGANAVTIILEEEFDRRPTVLRAGKLPKELKWFSDLDIDADGQVALWEWRRGGKEMDDFATHDRNGDGFITAEEAMRMNVPRTGSGRGNGSEADADDGGTVRSNPFMTRGNEDGARKDFFGGKNGKGMGGKDGGGKKNKKGGLTFGGN